MAALAVTAYAAKVFTSGSLLSIDSEDLPNKKKPEHHALFKVRINDLIYTGRGEKVSTKSGDMGEGLIVGDPVEAAVDGKHLYLKKPGGRELKTMIIKRERADAGAASLH